MRKDEVRKTPHEVGFFADFLWKTVGAADDDDDVFTVYKKIFKLGCEFW